MEIADSVGGKEGRGVYTAGATVECEKLRHIWHKVSHLSFNHAEARHDASL